MSLKLTITSYQRLSPGQETTQILERGSLSIGRTVQSDWILQDPERILSSKHCTVHYQDGGYFLTDTSTNGVYLNDAEQRLVRNRQVRLNDGDRFVLGEYEIVATLLPTADELDASVPDGPLTDIVPFPGLGASDSLLPSTPVGPSGGRQDRARPSFSDLLADDLDASHPELLARSHPADRIVTEPPPDLSAPDRAFFEPPALIPETVPPLPEIPDVLTDSPSAIPSEPVAEAILPEEAVIPDDWWLGPSVAAPPPIPLAVPPPVALPVPPVAARPVDTAGPSAKDLLRPFLQGAGLPQARLADDRLPETLTCLGAIFRETVQGLAEILRARGDIKGEFRLDRTTIGPIENNPLKTPPGQPPLSPEEIMILLLVSQPGGYMSPVEAVHEAFTDIKAHQVAVMAGIQAALNRLLERFDPGNLETRLRQTMFDSILPASRKAKYWDLFTAEYQAIAREAEDDFNELFGDEFARAYQERLRAK